MSSSNPDFVVQPWHTYLAFVCITWLCCAFCIFGNRFLPLLQQFGLLLITGGGLVTIIVVSVMPSQHATNSFVWKDFENQTGWSNGVAFLTGVLNGAFAIGTPDSVTHMAEELPNPKADLPKAIAAQLILGTVTAFCFAVAILYGISDLDAVLGSSGSFPLAEVYAQATGNKAGAFGLLMIVFLSVMICCVGTFLTLSRSWWALARDDVVPFPKFFSKVDERLSCPVPATVFCAIFATALGAIGLGSKTAFTDLVGSFIVLTTVSYTLAILPHLLTGRKNVPKGPFWMGKAGYVVNAIACISMIFFDIFYCFRECYSTSNHDINTNTLSAYAYPVIGSPDVMSYNSVVLVGCILIAVIWWFAYSARHYGGPKLAGLYLIEGVDEGVSEE